MSVNRNMVENSDFVAAAQYIKPEAAGSAFVGSGRSGKLSGHAGAGGTQRTAGEHGDRHQKKFPRAVVQIAESYTTEVAVTQHHGGPSAKVCRNCKESGHFWAECSKSYDEGNWREFRTTCPDLATRTRMPTNDEQYRQVQERIRSLRASSNGNSNNHSGSSKSRNGRR